MFDYIRMMTSQCQVDPICTGRGTKEWWSIWQAVVTSVEFSFFPQEMRNLHHDSTLWMRKPFRVDSCSYGLSSFQLQKRLKSCIFFEAVRLPKGSSISWCSQSFPSGVIGGRGITIPQVAVEQTVIIPTPQYIIKEISEAYLGAKFLSPVSLLPF